METRESISNQIYTVTPRGSIKTSKPSTVEMAIGHRLANRIDELNQDIKEGLEVETGLIRLELIAIYEDGKIEEKEVVDLELSNGNVAQKITQMEQTLETAVDEAKDLDLYSEEEKENTTPFEDYEKEETEKVDE